MQFVGNSGKNPVVRAWRIPSKLAELRLYREQGAALGLVKSRECLAWPSPRRWRLP